MEVALKLLGTFGCDNRRAAGSAEQVKRTQPSVTNSMKVQTDRQTGQSFCIPYLLLYSLFGQCNTRLQLETLSIAFDGDSPRGHSKGTACSLEPRVSYPYISLKIDGTSVHLPGR